MYKIIILFRTDTAIGTGHQDVAVLRADAVLLKRQHAQHGRIARRADRHGGGR